MLEDIHIRRQETVGLREYLENLDCLVEEVTESVFIIKRLGELPIFVQFDDGVLNFEVDLGSAKDLGGDDALFALLDLNTEILPVSVGIDTTEAEDPRLVLVESREVANLDDNEMGSVLAALEIAADKVESVLSQFIA